MQATNYVTKILIIALLIEYLITGSVRVWTKEKLKFLITKIILDYRSLCKTKQKQQQKIIGIIVQYGTTLTELTLAFHDRGTALYVQKYVVW